MNDWTLLAWRKASGQPEVIRSSVAWERADEMRKWCNQTGFAITTIVKNSWAGYVLG